MADSSDPLLQECRNCGTQIDVSDEEPFAQMHCPACGAAMRVRRQFGSFELQEILGAGGMGAVYRALDNNLHRQVALKLLRKEYSANPEFIRQFAHEAAITAAINHPNVVKVYSSGSDHGLFYIAMELVDKGSLDDLMTLEKKVGEMQVLDVGIQIAQGLNAALERGLIHRDVKPGNILFADAQTAKIVDFGLAVPMDQAGTLGGEIWGTPYYVAPEKLDNKPEDLRSDIFSLAASLFHAASARPPHDSDDTSIAALKKAKSKAVSLQTFAPEISSATAYVINRALHPDPDERYASYKDFIEHLQYAKEQLRQKSAQLRAKNKAAHPPPASQKKGANWGAIGLLGALILGCGLLFGFREHLFPSRANAPKETEIADRTAEDIRGDYEKSCRLLVAGKYPEAAAGFAAVVENVLTPQPMKTWAAAHAGLAATLAGDATAARSYWRQVVDQGLFSDEPQEQKLAQWFLDTANLALSDAPFPPGTEDNYARSNYEPFALLALGIESWAESSYDQAERLLKAFIESSPELGNSWVSNYKPIAQAHLAELAEYRELAPLIAGDTAAAQRETTLATLKGGLTRLKLEGPHRQRISEAVDLLERKIATYNEEQAKALAAQEAADAKALAEVQPKAAALMAKFRFAEARTLLSSVQVASEKGRQSKQDHIRRIEWPGEFKAQLIRDIGAAGYPVPLFNRAGGKLPGTLARATDQQLEFRSEYGMAPVQWTDVSVESLLQMAKSFIRPDATPERRADREWLLGSFAYFAGKFQEAKTLLNSAANIRPEYKTMLSAYPDLAAN